MRSAGESAVESGRDDPSTERRLAGVATLCALVVVGFAIPVGLTAHYRALGVPRSDDWSYLVTLFRLVDHGRLSFNHWVSMSLVGQLLVAAPVALVSTHDVGALQVTTALLGVVGLTALAGTARTLGVSWFGVLLVTGGVAAGPLWGPLSVSFMTDVPAFAFSSVSLLLATIALRRRPAPTGLLVAAVAVGWFAFTIRQYAIVTVIAVLATVLVDRATTGDRAGVRRWLVVVVLVGLATLGFLAWWHSVPDGRSLAPALPSPGSVRRTIIKAAGFVRLVGLLCLPVLCWSRPVARLRRVWAETPIVGAAVGTTTALWLAVTAVRTPGDAFVGNYFMRDGALSNIVLVGRRPDVMPRSAWLALVLLASMAGVVLALVVVPPLVTAARRLRTRDRTAVEPVTLLLGLGTVGYAGAYLLAMATRLQVYDRYALPLIALVALALAWSRPAVVPAPREAPDRPRRDACRAASPPRSRSVGSRSSESPTPRIRRPMTAPAGAWPRPRYEPGGRHAPSTAASSGATTTAATSCRRGTRPVPDPRGSWCA